MVLPIGASGGFKDAAPPEGDTIDWYLSISPDEHICDNEPGDFQSVPKQRPWKSTPTPNIASAATTKIRTALTAERPAVSACRPSGPPTTGLAQVTIG
ncbi:hypothetical protein GCM10027344_18790 [Spelaeicoccus albus]